MGIASSMPGTPHNQLQKRIPAKSAMRFICDTRPMSAGINQYPSMVVMTNATATTPSAPLTVPNWRKPTTPAKSRGDDQRAKVRDDVEDASRQPPHPCLLETHGRQRQPGRDGDNHARKDLHEHETLYLAGDVVEDLYGDLLLREPRSYVLD